MARHGILLVRLSLGVVFLWFGALKSFPGFSPGQNLATHTIDVLTFGTAPASVSVPILAAWECLVGLALLFGVFPRAALLLIWLQMLGALTPTLESSYDRTSSTRFALIFEADTTIIPGHSDKIKGSSIGRQSTLHPRLRESTDSLWLFFGLVFPKKERLQPVLYLEQLHPRPNTWKRSLQNHLLEEHGSVLPEGPA